MILALLLFWPFSHHHVERFSFTMDKDGQFIHEFKRDFPTNDGFSCTFKSKHSDSTRIMVKQRGGVHLLGHSGEQGKAVCE